MVGEGIFSLLRGRGFRWNRGSAPKIRSSWACRRTCRL